MVITNQYDELNRLTNQISVNGYQVSYAYDPATGQRLTDLTKVYAHGLDLISQQQPGVATNYYGHDGHGSVRFLADTIGAITDTYTYDAYGTLIAQTPSAGNQTPNNYLYAGQQFDPNFGLYYNRARYLNPDTGRFWTMDTFAGNNEDPLSLHKYLYCQGNPVNRIDPSGHDGIELAIDFGMMGILASMPNLINIGQFAEGYSYSELDPTGYWQVSLADVEFNGETFKGFHARYLPSTHPSCPCQKQDIFLSQAIITPAFDYFPAQFDVGKRPGDLPSHGRNDPIPGYYWNSNPTDPLTIIDAPHYATSPNFAGTWTIEDCAICRTHPNAGAVDDKVLGSVKFTFSRSGQDTVTLSVQQGGNSRTENNVYVNAERPGTLWETALQDWRQRGH